MNVANDANGKIYAGYRGVNDYFYLRRFSDSLVQENAKLRAQLYESKYDNKIDSGMVSDSTSKTVQHYNYITARVIQNSVNHSANLIYLDRGKLQGVKKEMGVINGNGIVGQVISVTDNYAAVMSVLINEIEAKNFEREEEEK